MKVQHSGGRTGKTAVESNDKGESVFKSSVSGSPSEKLIQNVRATLLVSLLPALFLLYGCQCLSSMAKQKGTGDELPEIGTIQLLDDEAIKFLTGRNTPWQLHVSVGGGVKDTNNKRN